MRIFKPKDCKYCGVEYIPTGSSSKFCCHEHLYLWQKENGVQKQYRDTANAKIGRKVGIGSGGTTGKGSNNHMYKNGYWSFKNYAKELKNLGVPCNRCGIDLRTTGKRGYVGHHIDHDQTNNNLNNLELLCRKCHALHHDHPKNLREYLEKVQRPSRKGVENSVLEAQNIQLDGDMVWPV